MKGSRAIGVGGLVALALAGCGDTTINKTVQTVTTVAPTSTLEPYRVPSNTMAPTMPEGTNVLVQTENYTPKLGDIVIFHPPKDATQEVCGPSPHVIKIGGAACSQPEKEKAGVNFIKRIVAGPGDVISIIEGHVIRNGVREKDSYIRPCGSSPECSFPTPIRIPAGHWYMMGDNRGESDDSRFWGPVPAEWITGGVVKSDR